MRSTYMKMILFDRYYSPDHFGTSFAIFRLTMKKWEFRQLFNLNCFNQFQNDIKGKVVFML